MGREGLFLLFCCFLMIPLAWGQGEVGVRVVVAADSETVTLNKGMLRSVFSMRQTHWQNGTKIIVYVQSSDSAEHQQFTRQVLGLFPYQLQRIWDKNAFTGIGGRPKVVTGDEQMVQAIASTPGAIGYVSASADLQGANLVIVN